MGGSLLVLGLSPTLPRMQALRIALTVLERHLRCSLRTPQSGFIDEVGSPKGLQQAVEDAPLLLRVEHALFPWDDFEPELQGHVGAEDPLGRFLLPGLQTITLQCSQSVEHLVEHPSERRRPIARQQWHLLRQVLQDALVTEGIEAVASASEENPSLLEGGVTLLGLRRPTTLATIVGNLPLGEGGVPSFSIPDPARFEAFVRSSAATLVRSCGWTTVADVEGLEAAWWLSPALARQWEPPVRMDSKPRDGMRAQPPMPRLLLTLANSALIEVIDLEDRRVLDRLRRAGGGNRADQYFRAILGGFPAHKARRNRYLAELGIGLSAADGLLAQIPLGVVPALEGGPSSVLLEGVPKGTYRSLEESLITRGSSMLLRGKLQGPTPGQVQVVAGYLPPRELRVTYARPIEGKGFGSFDVCLYDDGRNDPAVVVRKYTFPPISAAQEDRIERSYRRLLSILGPFGPRSVEDEGPTTVVTLPRSEALPLLYRLLQELYDSDPVMADIGLQFIGVGEGPLVALLERKATVLYELRVDDYQMQGDILSDHALWSPVFNENRRMVQFEVSLQTWPELASVIVEVLPQLELARLCYDRRQGNDPYAPTIRLELLHRRNRSATQMTIDFCHFPDRQSYAPVHAALERALGATLIPVERAYR